MYNHEDKQAQAEFENACKPLLEFLQKYGNPHTTIIMDLAHAEMVQGEMITAFKLLD